MIRSRRDVLKLLGMSMAATQIPAGIFANERTIPFTSPSHNAKLISSFNPSTGEWEIDWPAKVSQYDLVYKSPPIDPLQGIPLGNGDIGVLAWCEETKINIVINKSDLWHDAVFEDFHNWSKEEEDYSTTLRHACRVVIDFKFPVFSTLFLSDFTARLQLSDGSLFLHCKTPFGELQLQAFVDYKTGTIFFDLHTQFDEMSATDVYVERYGSRTFAHWYSQINRDASIGTDGTSSSADINGVYIVQELNDVSFAAGATVIKNNGSLVSYSREHSRLAKIHLGSEKEKKIQFAVKVSSPGKNNVLSSLKDELSVVRKDIDSYKASNTEVWKSLWSRSFIDYGDDYLTNLWYLTIFYAITSQGGRYPGRFNNGMWSWSRDVQNWNFYFHWNQQQLYWPLNAAGFHELVDPYLEFRFRSLPHAKKDAQKHFKSDGAFISDVVERRGFNSVNELINHTPVAEIALDFWRQYQYTGDQNFLKEKALPFIMEAAKFFDSLFIKEADGYYHATEGSGYEGWIHLKDGLTELVYGRMLFSVALDALTAAGIVAPESKKWKEILDNLAPMQLVKADLGTIENIDGTYKLKTGYFKGQTISTDKITAAGWGIKEKEWLTVYRGAENGTYFGLKLLDGIFPTVASSAVFPSNCISLSHKEKDNSLFEAVRTTTLLYSPGITGWDPSPIVQARLGLADALAKTLEFFPERWQIYCNGWGHWGLEGEINKDAEWFFRTNNVRDVSKAVDQKIPFPMWPFRHMSMESMSVFATAVNESLLQSHEGFIRVVPAFPANKCCKFTLHATGGFVVSAQITAGVIEWICIVSKLGKVCSIKNPWSKPGLFLRTKRIKYTSDKDIITFKTKAGDIVIMLPDGQDINNWQRVRHEVKQNEEAKLHSSGKSKLGLPRMF